MPSLPIFGKPREPATPSIPSRLRKWIGPFGRGLRIVADARPGSVAAQGVATAGSWLSLFGSATRATVALSIEPDAIRAVVVRNGRVVNYQTEYLDGNFVRDGVVVQTAALGGILNQFFQQHLLPRDGVVVSLAGLRTSAFRLELPPTKPAEISRYVETETTRRLGVDPEDVAIHWVTLEAARRENDLFVVVVPRDTIGAMVEALRAGGIRPAAFDLKPLALGRAAGLRDAIVASVERHSLDIVIVVGDLPVVMRSLPVEEAGIEREELHARLIREVERTLLQYAGLGERPLRANVPIVLCGSMCAGIALAEQLRVVTRHPIGRPAPPFEMGDAFPVTDFLANLGSALVKW